MATKSVTTAVVHVLGPWEEAGWEDGAPYEEQRCLRCDSTFARRPAAVSQGPPQKGPRGWRVGHRLAVSELADGSMFRFNADDPPAAARAVDLSDCRT